MLLTLHSAASKVTEANNLHNLPALTSITVALDVALGLKACLHSPVHTPATAHQNASRPQDFKLRKEEKVMMSVPTDPPVIQKVNSTQPESVTKLNRGMTFLMCVSVAVAVETNTIQQQIILSKQIRGMRLSF